MRRCFGFLAGLWRSLVFLSTIRAVASQCRSRRLYAVDR
jgi:hypothetical protein